jgi:hypothetical protein
MSNVMITYSGGELKHVQCLVERPDGERSFGRHRRIKMDLKEVGWLGVDWTDLAKDRDK